MCVTEYVTEYVTNLRGGGVVLSETTAVTASVCLAYSRQVSKSWSAIKLNEQTNEKKRRNEKTNE